MAKKETTTEVTSAQSSSVGFPIDFAADAGMGMEGADKSSFAIPFITMLQGLSPQLETVDGAKPGKFINTITNELYDEVMVVPCAYQRRFLRWSPRSSGGGYKGEFNPIEVETGALPGLKQINGIYLMDVPEGAPAFDPKGLPLYDHLSDTRNHFVLAKNASGGWQPALISLSSTQIKKSKRWMSLIQGVEMEANGRHFNPPSFSSIYKLKPIKEENSKGSWWGLDISRVGFIEDGELYGRAKDFHSQVASGAVEVAPPPASAESGGDAGGDERF
jgi:hypothetical protein